MIEPGHPSHSTPGLAVHALAESARAKHTSAVRARANHTSAVLGNNPLDAKPARS